MSQKEKRKLSKNYTPLPPVEDSELLFQPYQFAPPTNGVDVYQMKAPPLDFLSTHGGDKSIENDLRKKLLKVLVRILDSA